MKGRKAGKRGATGGSPPPPVARPPARTHTRTHAHTEHAPEVHASEKVLCGLSRVRKEVSRTTWVFPTVMELLSCLTLCSSCSRSSFSSELHFISFCFSSSLARKHTPTLLSPLSVCHQQSQEEESRITFFVSDVGMNNSQRSRPGNGFLFLQDLQQNTQKLSQRSRLAKA